MPKICLQVGHQNIQYNSIEALQGSTGAPQEMGTNYKVVSRTAELLRQRGFEVKQTDANANADPLVTDVDWDMYLAVHCDADSALLSGGFVDHADPIIDDAAVESSRIAEAIESVFFKETGIVDRPEREGKSDGVLFYYMWSVLTSKTPCVLIEMGESVDAHDRVILNDTERCAKALTRGICNAFGVVYDLPTPQPPVVEPPVVVTPPVVDPCKENLKKINTIANSSWLTWLRNRQAVRDLSK
ncbi:N-acetylmuramoyl-L-alanine amidase [Candidatus Dojkabacteria bacterium]|jgi:hypothetical protein|nr:N-acetylmuramoyl-L-alanine amidase [Candidatus Dojkabacteria bacterium]